MQVVGRHLDGTVAFYADDVSNAAMACISDTQRCVQSHIDRSHGLGSAAGPPLRSASRVGGMLDRDPYPTRVTPRHTNRMCNVQVVGQFWVA